MLFLHAIPVNSHALIALQLVDIVMDLLHYGVLCIDLTKQMNQHGNLVHHVRNVILIEKNVIDIHHFQIKMHCVMDV